MSRMFYLSQLGNFQNREPELASQCIECGKCVKHCPQSIDIPEELKKVKKEFEGITTKPMMFLVNKMFLRGQRKKAA